MPIQSFAESDLKQIEDTTNGYMAAVSELKPEHLVALHYAVAGGLHRRHPWGAIFNVKFTGLADRFDRVLTLQKIHRDDDVSFAGALVRSQDTEEQPITMGFCAHIGHALVDVMDEFIKANVNEDDTERTQHAVCWLLPYSVPGSRRNLGLLQVLTRTVGLETAPPMLALRPRPKQSDVLDGPSGAV